MLKHLLTILILSVTTQAHAQWYRLDVDTQSPQTKHTIPATFEGNTPFIKVGFYNDQTAASLSNDWSMTFWYSKNQSTATGVQIPGTWASNNIVDFRGDTNAFYRSGKYFFSVSGIHNSGYVKTFGRGTMYQEYDPSTDTNLQSIIGQINADWWTNNLGQQVFLNETDIAALQAGASTNGALLTGLQSQITSNDIDIAALQAQATSNDTDIAALDARVTSNEVNIVSNRLYAGTGLIITNNAPTNYIALSTASQASLTLADSAVQDTDTGLTLGGNFTSTGTLDAYEGITLREGVAESVGTGWDGDNNTPRKTDIFAAIDSTGTTPNYSLYEFASPKYVEDAITARGGGPSTNTYGPSWSTNIQNAAQSNIYAAVAQDGSTTNDRSVYKIASTEYVEDAIAQRATYTNGTGIALDGYSYSLSNELFLAVQDWIASSNELKLALLTTGTRAMSGDLNMGGNSVTNIATMNTSGNVGIGTDTPHDMLHVYSASSGGGASNTNYDGIVIENSSHEGITIRTPSNSYGGIMFGDPQDADEGRIRYNHSDDSMDFSTLGLKRLLINSDGFIGIGTTDPQSTLHVKTATSGYTNDAYSSSYDELILENSGNAGITIINGNANNGAINFGDEDDPANGIFMYNHANDEFRWYVGPSSTRKMTLDDAGQLGIGITAPVEALHVNGNVNVEDVLILNMDDPTGTGSGHVEWAIGGVTNIQGNWRIIISNGEFHLQKRSSTAWQTHFYVN